MEHRGEWNVAAERLGKIFLVGLNRQSEDFVKAEHL